LDKKNNNIEIKCNAAS